MLINPNHKQVATKIIKTNVTSRPCVKLTAMTNTLKPKAGTIQRVRRALAHGATSTTVRSRCPSNEVRLKRFDVTVGWTEKSTPTRGIGSR